MSVKSDDVAATGAPAPVFVSIADQEQDEPDESATHLADAESDHADLHLAEVAFTSEVVALVMRENRSGVVLSTLIQAR